jgi:hypothetical protein
MSADNEHLHFRKPQVIGDIHEQPLPRSENQRVHGSLLPRPTIIHAASLESTAPDGVAPRWRKRHH